MSSEARLIRIFVGSPGDVWQERERAELVINEVNRDLGDALGVRIEAIRWENYVAPLMGRPEQVVLDQVKLEEWDIFLGILWLRFGTPTGATHPETDSKYYSGTEEEFQIAYKSWIKTGKPLIMFYRCIKPPEAITDIDVEQFTRITGFFQGFNPEESHPGIVRSFKKLDEFERRLREDLSKVVRSISINKSIHYGSLLNPEHINYGFIDLFLPHTNEDRNSEKRSAIKKANDMRLIAHSGHSFFSAVGHRYRKEVTDRLENGAVFRAVISNPWSLSGLFIALGAMENKSKQTLSEYYHSVLGGKIDPIKIVEDSDWYSIKFKDSISGYKQLAEKYSEQIQVKLTRHDLPATIFLTENYCSFEPYINVNLSDRARVGMITFELHTQEDSHLYHNSSSFFDLMWNLSDSFNEFIKRESIYKQDMARTLFI